MRQGLPPAGQSVALPRMTAYVHGPWHMWVVGVAGLTGHRAGGTLWGWELGPLDGGRVAHAAAPCRAPGPLPEPPRILFSDQPQTLPGTLGGLISPPEAITGSATTHSPGTIVPQALLSWLWVDGSSGPWEGGGGRSWSELVPCGVQAPVPPVPGGFASAAGVLALGRVILAVWRRSEPVRAHRQSTPRLCFVFHVQGPTAPRWLLSCPPELHLL